MNPIVGYQSKPAEIDNFIELLRNSNLNDMEVIRKIEISFYETAPLDEGQKQNVLLKMCLLNCWLLCHRFNSIKNKQKEIEDIKKRLNKIKSKLKQESEPIVGDVPKRSVIQRIYQFSELENEKSNEIVQFVSYKIFKEKKNYKPLFESTPKNKLNCKNFFDCVKGKGNISVIILTDKSLVATFSRKILPTTIENDYFEDKTFRFYELYKEKNLCFKIWKQNNNYSFLFFRDNEIPFGTVTSVCNAFELRVNVVDFNPDRDAVEENDSPFLIDEKGFKKKDCTEKKEEDIKKVVVVQWECL